MHAENARSEAVQPKGKDISLGQLQTELVSIIETCAILKPTVRIKCIFNCSLNRKGGLRVDNTTALLPIQGYI